MPCARRLALATIPSDGCRHRYWLPSADATVKGRTIFHRTAGPSTSACKGRHSLQDAPHTGSSRQRIRNNVFQDCKLAHQAQITGISHSVKEILPPDLLDLTQLQKEANIRYGFTASEVYDIAQSLYEKKLISYPRTSSRYLTEDVFDSLPPIMACLLSWELFPAAKGTGGIDISNLSRHVISAEKPMYIMPSSLQVSVPEICPKRKCRFTDL